MSSHALLEEDVCPVPLELLGRLLVGSPAFVDEEIARLPMAKRARLALFCYARCHLRDLAMRAAAACDQQSLVSVAGHAGAVLRTQAMAMQSGGAADVAPGGRKRISLARSAA